MIEFDVLAIIFSIAGNILVHLCHGFEWIVKIYQFVFKALPEKMDLDDF